MRRIAALVVALVLAGCGFGNGSVHEPTTAPRRGATLSWTRFFDLPAGPATRQFRIVAPAPPKHTWDVRLTAPAASDVGLRIRTWYGQEFRVVESTLRERGSCELRGEDVSCLARFPALEAQRAGRWTVVVTKASGAAAGVSVAIVFEPLTG